MKASNFFKARSMLQTWNTQFLHQSPARKLEELFKEKNNNKKEPGYIFHYILIPIKPLKMHQTLLTLIQK